MDRYTRKRNTLMVVIAAIVVLFILLLLSGCGQRRCPAGFVNDGNDNCVNDGRGGGQNYDDDREWDDD